MLKFNSTLASLCAAAIVTAGVAFGIENWRTNRAADRSAASGAGGTVNAVRLPRPFWAASAPGRVEPRYGEARIGAQIPGKVMQVAVRMNDMVKAGDLLVRLTDDDAFAKLAAVTAEIAVRRRERDAETAPKLAVDRRNAEDTMSVAERNQFRARMELDQLLLGVEQGKSTPEAITAARTALSEAGERVEQERANVRRVQALAGVPLPTRLDSAVTTARAELATIEAAIERTRIRAPSDGTVLQVNTRVGETVTPSPEDVLLTFGDLSQLRVRAEIEERDITKVHVGQAVVVRSDTFPGLEFAGRIDQLAQALGPQRLTGRGPRRPTDIDVLMVMISLDGPTKLLPGMRVDVFFKPDATRPEAAAAGSEPATAAAAEAAPAKPDAGVKAN